VQTIDNSACSFEIGVLVTCTHLQRDYCSIQIQGKAEERVEEVNEKYDCDRMNGTTAEEKSDDRCARARTSIWRVFTRRARM
jgi:hypothetical protein